MNHTEEEEMVPSSVSYHSDLFIQLMSVMVIMTSNSCESSSPG